MPNSRNSERARLVPGQFADIVVLSRDITAIDAPQILDTEVLTTIIDGVVTVRAQSIVARLWQWVAGESIVQGTTARMLVCRSSGRLVLSA